MKKFGFILLMLATLALSCTREPSTEHNSSETGFKTIHYKVQVASSNNLKATTADNDTKYVFQSTDALYVSSTDPVSGDLQLFGVLELMYGSGETVAYFEGDLVGVDEFEPASDTPITVTLVNPNDRIHTTGGGKLTGTAYPSNEYATSFAEAVQKFSHFTSTCTFGSKRITLQQNSTFLICVVTMSTDDMPDATNADISIESGGASIWSGTITSTVSADHSVLSFVLAFPGDEIELDTPELIIEWVDGSDNDKNRTFSDLTDGALLEANNYYTISRTTIVPKYGGFRIIALADGTITSTDIAGLEYSLDEGDTWTSYSTGIPVHTGDEVCFRATAANSTNSKKISSSANFAIAGDLVSLLIGSNFDNPSPVIPNSYTFVNLFTSCTQLTDASGLVFSMPTVPSSALKSFFEGCTNLVAGPAELTATTVGQNCYRNMFNGCTKLTSAPIIRKPTNHNSTGWYQQMFKNCSKLQEIIFLDDYAYNSTNFTDWVNGINASGTFYVPDKDNNNPFGANRGNSAIPSGWTVETYSE